LVERPTAGEGEGSIPSGNTTLLRNSEIGNTQGVLDGDLDAFINRSLEDAFKQGKNPDK